MTSTLLGRTSSLAQLTRSLSNRTSSGDLAVIQTPSNRVKLQVELVDLPLAIVEHDADQVKAADTVGSARNGVELEVPDDLVAAGRANVQGLDARGGWLLEDDALDPFGLGGGLASAVELTPSQSDLTHRLRKGLRLTGRPWRDRTESENSAKLSARRP